MEVLMVQRPLTSRFMPGVWVFPGGAVDDADANAPASFGPSEEGADWYVAALRELIEETGIWLTTEGARSMPLEADVFSAVESSRFRLDQNRLIYFSNWITPSAFPIRFDTRFFLAIDDGDVEATYNGGELIGLSWISPLDALARHREGVWDIAFPTRKILELLATQTSTDVLADELRSLKIVTSIEPRLHVGESEAGILLPDDPGFAAAGPQQSDPTILDRLARVVERGGSVPVEFKKRS